GAENAFVEAVEPRPLLRRLAALGGGRGLVVLQIGLDLPVLVEERLLVYHQVADHRHPGQGSDDQVAVAHGLVDRGDAGERVPAADVHAAGSAAALRAGAAWPGPRVPVPDAPEHTDTRAVALCAVPGEAVHERGGGDFRAVAIDLYGPHLWRRPLFCLSPS